MAEQAEKIQMSINEGEPFFAHEMSINFNPTQIILDFKCITPRVDPRSHKAPVIHVKHNVVMVDPFHAKQALELLEKVLKNYEQEFGKIQKPKAIAVAEKRSKKKPELEAQSRPEYFG